MPPKEDWETPIRNVQKKFGQDRTCSSGYMLVDRKTQTYAHLNAATHLEVEGVNYYTINYKHQGGVISIFIKTLNIFKPSEFFLQALKQINKYMLFCYARA